MFVLPRISGGFAIFGFMLAATLPALQAKAETKFRVVIDPGHGGSDVGTVYDSGTRRIAEKDVTLLLAKETANQLRKRGIETILTRTSDKDIALPTRTLLANRAKADVFLSIHMNSGGTLGTSGEAEGVETFILNNTSDASSRRLARLENSGVRTGDPDAPDQLDVSLILKDLRLDANLSESKRLACSVQKHLVSVTRRTNASPAAHHRNRGVKQALFYVLLGADMPSALLEAGFLSNARDRALVLSTEGQHSIASAVARAIDEYKRQKNTPKALSELSRCQVH